MRATTFRATGVWLVAASAMGLGGCADTDGLEPSLGRARDAIVGGAPVDKPAAVRLAGAGNCMGTLVALDLVLTAKHCVVPFEGGGPFECDEAGELVVDPDAEVTYVGAGEFADEPTPPDTFSIGLSPQAPRGEAIFLSAGDSICASDLALVALDKPVDDPTLAPLRLDAYPEVGETLLAVGHGQHEGGNQSDELLGVEVNVLAVGPEPAVSDVSSAVTPDAFQTTDGICRGDSGSAAFADSGAAVGVASRVGRPDLEMPTGGPDDCVGSRATFVATAAETTVIEEAFAHVGATPWLEGEPDPRAGLAGFEQPCGSDADCQSNVCLPDADGESRCSHGCEASDCPDGYGCEVVDDRLRCLASPAPPTSMGGNEGADGGCAVSRQPSEPSAGWWLLMVLGVLRVRAPTRRRSGSWASDPPARR